MFKQTMLKKIFYISAFLITSLVGVQYLPVEWVILVTFLLFIMMSGYLKTENKMPLKKCHRGVNINHRVTGSLMLLAKESVDSLTENKNDLVNLITLQEDAMATLMEAFLGIEMLLNQQQSEISYHQGSSSAHPCYLHQSHPKACHHSWQNKPESAGQTVAIHRH